MAGRKRIAGGFTLIEVLVALVLLSLLAVTSYRALNSVLETDARGRSEQAFWQQLAGCWPRIAADLQDAVPVRLPTAERGVFVTQRTPAGAVSFSLNRQIPQDAGGGLQQLRYAFSAGRLTRDAAGSAAGAANRSVQILLEGVERMEFRYMDGTGRWLPDWSPSAAELPRAIEFLMSWPDGRHLRRVFRIQ